MKIDFKHNAPTFLTYLGAVGVVATAILSATATPKVLQRMEDATDEKGEDLTVMESIRVAAPLYIPAALTGLATLSCIFGVDSIYKKRQMSLMSAYMMLNNLHSEYKKQVVERFGDDADAEIQESVSKTSKPTEKVLFYDMHMGEYFESTMELFTFDDGLECYIVNTSSIF